MFKKVLIANRGEIAVRIAATLQEMGIVAVGVYSDADRGAVHVSACDEAYPLEGVSSADTYLRGDKIIEIAKRCGAEAIHPGYGFLSENEDFAQACSVAGLIFIGPSPTVIRAMGDKILAKKTFADAGVPVVPGWAGSGDAPPDEIRKRAEEIGYPVLVKAAAGGGGKGMRIVERAGDLSSAMDSARREAGAAFGDDRIFLEKYINRPRHVEFQIFGDAHGNVVHLFERECSIQRRYQKIVEESPSPALTPALREKMGQAAVTAAKAIGYTNAGTVEFMVAPGGAFYFLEVNTRLQVEHPITEMVTRQDLVRAQLLVAAGERLPFTQDALRQDGHAIECRIYAEDPAEGFLPSIGVIDRFIAPAGPGIRVDAGVKSGSEVSVYYDPMLAKLIAWAPTREQSVQKMLWALQRFVVLGVSCNVDFLQRLLQHPDFQAGRIHTHFLSEHPDIAARPAEAICDEALAAAALTASIGGTRNNHFDMAASASRGEYVGPWQAGRWRSLA